jgi:hypothetical protein
MTDDPVDLPDLILTPGLVLDLKRDRDRRLTPTTLGTMIPTTQLPALD